jgi:hypothetical protein
MGNNNGTVNTRKPMAVGIENIGKNIEYTIII